jgi:hypothetical protein
MNKELVRENTFAWQLDLLLEKKKMIKKWDTYLYYKWAYTWLQNNFTEKNKTSKKKSHYWLALWNLPDEPGEEH